MSVIQVGLVDTTGEVNPELLQAAASFLDKRSDREIAWLTTTLGAILGVLVSISSVGAGAIWTVEYDATVTSSNRHFSNWVAHWVAESGKSCFARTTCADLERRPDANGV